MKKCTRTERVTKESQIVTTARFFYINFVMNKHTSSKLLSTTKSVMNSSESLQMFPHFDKHYSVLTLEDISLSKSSLDYCQQVEVPENI